VGRIDLGGRTEPPAHPDPARVVVSTDFPIIPPNEVGSKAPLRKRDPVDRVMTLWTNKRGLQGG